MSNQGQLLQELLEESREHLSAMEPILLSLDRTLDISLHDLNSAFRAIHSIKGEFGFFDIIPVIQISHQMESILDQLRLKDIEINKTLTTALLSGFDCLTELIEDLDNVDKVDIEEILNKLTMICKGQDLDSNKTKLNKNDNFTLSSEVIPWNEYKYHFFITMQVDKCLSIDFAKYNNSNNVFTLTKIREYAKDKYVPYLDDEDYLYVLSTPLSASLLADVLNISEKFLLPVCFKKEVEEVVINEIHTDTPAHLIQPEPLKRLIKSELNDSLRVKVKVLDELMNQAGEMVLNRNQLNQILQRKNHEFIDFSKSISAFSSLSKSLLLKIDKYIQKSEFKNELKLIYKTEMDHFEQVFQDELNSPFKASRNLQAILQSLDRNTTNLQEQVMHTRMQQISSVFNRFPRVVRDLSMSLKKKVELEISGSEVELDKGIIEKIFDPLVHLLRNSIDHGIELPEEREALGKNRQGLVKISAFHQGGKVHIQIEDDGAGIDTAAIIKRAIAKELLSVEESKLLTKNQIYQFVFMAGFSTAEALSEVSGRGVGMDVVKSNIEELGGVIEINSKRAKGTKISINLPLTLAIIPCLIISAQGKKFAIPQINLEELVRLQGEEIPTRVESVRNCEMLRLRGELVQLVRLSDVLDMPKQFFNSESNKWEVDSRSQWSDRRVASRSEKSDRRSYERSVLLVVIIIVGKNRFGLVVDKVYDNEEIVVKKVSSFLKKVEIYSGVTISGDGSVTMILDVHKVISHAKLDFDSAKHQDEKQDLVNEKQEVLLFENKKNETYCLHLDLVQRVESVCFSDLQKIGDSLIYIFNGKSIPVVLLSDLLNCPPIKSDVLECFLIIPKQVSNPIGILVERILDTHKVDLILEKVKIPYMLGNFLLKGKVIHMLNLYDVFELAFPGEITFKNQEKVLQGKVVLLAEDTKFFQQMIADFLTSIGAEVKLANDGAEALEFLTKASIKIDFLVSDVQMPNINGIQLIKNVRNMEEFKNLPIMALTSQNNDGIDTKVLDAGADVFEIKFSQERQFRAIQKLCKEYF
jgi:two-component system chemotaxis sensor kinase CheA